MKKYVGPFMLVGLLGLWLTMWWAGSQTTEVAMATSNLQRATAITLTPMPTVAINRSLQQRADQLKTEGNALAQSGTWQAALQKYAEALKLYQQAPDRDGEARTLFNIGLVYASAESATTSDYESAVAHYQQALTIWQELDDLMWQARALMNIAWTYDTLEDFKNAIDYYEKVLPLWRRQEDVPNEAVSLARLAANYQALGEHERALSLYQQVQPLLYDLENLAEEALAWKAIGLIQQLQGDSQAATESYTTALALWSEIGDSKENAITEKFLADTLLTQGEYYQALAAYERALDYWQTVDETARAAEVQDAIAFLYLTLGDYSRAVQAYQAALALEETTATPAQLAHLHERLGFVYSLLAEHDAALTAYVESLVLWRADAATEDIARVEEAIGTTYSWLQKPQAAADHWERAFALWQAEENQVRMARVLSKLGLLYATWGNAAQRAVFAEAATTFLHNTDLSDYRALLEARVALIYLALGDQEQTLRYLNRALDANAEGGDPLLQAQVTGTIAYVYESLDEQAKAILYYAEAIAQSEALRSSVRVEELATAFAADPTRTNLYNSLIQLLWQAKRYDEAFAYAERARARVFLDRIANQPFDLRRGATAPLLAQEQRLRQAMFTNETLIRAERAKNITAQAGDQLVQWERELTQLQQEYATLLVRLKTTNPEYASLLSAETVTVDEVQALLDEETTLISYFVTEEATFAWVIDPDNVTPIELTIAQSELVNTIDRARTRIATKSSADEPLAALYTALIAPLTPAIRQPNLQIVAHGQLHYLPFAALYDPATAHYLIEHYPISYLPTASTLRYLPAKANPYDGRLLALGNPDGTLSAAAAEATTIAEIFQTHAYTGTRATESLVRNRLAQTDILHLAAHGSYDAGNPLFSRIDLAAAQQADGKLELYEIWDLRATALNLVVLSACESGEGTLSQGDEMVGLTRAFMYAGAPSVVTSLWNVDDGGSAALMTAFYQHLVSGESVTTALHLAQRESAANATISSPYYWAAFVIHGMGNQTLTTMERP